MSLKTVQCTYAKNFTPGYDRVYTFETEDDVVPGELVWAEDDVKGHVEVQVIKVDEEYNESIARRFKMKKVFSQLTDRPMHAPEPAPVRTRL